MNNWNGNENKNKSEIGALAHSSFHEMETCDHNADSASYSTGIDRVFVHESICFVATALHTATKTFLFANQTYNEQKRATSSNA